MFEGGEAEMYEGDTEGGSMNMSGVGVEKIPSQLSPNAKPINAKSPAGPNVEGSKGI